MISYTNAVLWMTIPVTQAANISLKKTKSDRKKTSEEDEQEEAAGAALRLTSRSVLKNANDPSDISSSSAGDSSSRHSLRGKKRVGLNKKGKKYRLICRRWSKAIAQVGLGMM